jgi:molecular chaperone GrpE (heat shock protein)
MTNDPNAYPSPFLPPSEPVVQTQLVQRFLQLAGQMDTLQGQINRVATALEQERGQIDALLAYLQRDAQQPDPLQERLVELTEQMSADHDQLAYVGRKLTEVATQDQLVRLATVMATQRQVMDVVEVVQELSRTQSRATELADVRGRQVSDLLALLQEVLGRRRDLEAQHQVVDNDRLDAIRREARGEFAALFLPALDGLEAALDEGRMILTRHRQELMEINQPPGQPGAPPAGLVNRLRSRLEGESRPAEVGASMPSGQPHPEATAAAAAALNNWLRGLALVRERFLALLAQEGVQPIPTLRRPVDPRLHLVVQSEARNDVPPDTIVREVRRGFRQGTRVLRYAEVVTARAVDGA